MRPCGGNPKIGVPIDPHTITLTITEYWPPIECRHATGDFRIKLLPSDVRMDPPGGRRPGRARLTQLNALVNAITFLSRRVGMRL